MMARALGREVVFWYALPLAFLVYYVRVHHNPVSAAFEHLYAVSLFALSAFTGKLVLVRLFRRPRIVSLLVAATYAACLVIAVTYYSLVVIGLNSWGKVITEELIASYARQAPLLSDALHVSFELAVAVVAAGYLAAIGFCLWFLKPTWRVLEGLPAAASRPLSILLYAALLALLGWHLREFVLGADIRSAEPIQLTLKLGKPTNRASPRLVRQNAMLNQAELQARARYAAGESADRRNIVLIVVDALRPDHMGVYGYGRETTPYLSRLAREGRISIVKNVRASCGESVCALSSLASSRFVHQLPDTPFTLQQVLMLHGYQVRMILGGDHSNFYNLREMYGKVDDFFDGSMAKDHYMNDDSFVLERVRALKEWDGRPVMFQFHLMSVHSLGKRFPEFEVHRPFRSYAGKAKGSPSEEHTNHYDNGVLQTDAIIRKILGTLQEKNYLRNALVVVTADHGESLGEHQLYSHANSVREELLRLPLILLNPGGRPAIPPQGDRMVSQIDVAPTILHEMRIPVPASWAGKPLQSVPDNARIRQFSYFQYGGDIGLYDHRHAGREWKYWRNIYSNEEFAFDVLRDPGESKNRIAGIAPELKNEWRRLARESRIRFENAPIAEPIPLPD